VQAALARVPQPSPADASAELWALVGAARPQGVLDVPTPKSPVPVGPSAPSAPPAAEAAPLRASWSELAAARPGIRRRTVAGVAVTLATALLAVMLVRRAPDGGARRAPPPVVAPVPAPAPPAPPAVPDITVPNAVPDVAPNTTPDPADAVEPPVAITVLGAPADGRVRLGDSLRLRARLVDAHGVPTTAVVVWSSSDSARLQVRGGAVGRVRALAVGGPVTLTARAGALRRDVRIEVVAPPVANAPPDSAAPAPTAGAHLVAAAAAADSALHAARAALVAQLERRSLDTLARHLVAGEGASVPDFLRWLADADRFAVASVVEEGAPSVGPDRATCEVRVWMTWRSGLFNRSRHREAARFRLVLTARHGAWTVEEIRLVDPFPRA